MSHFRTIGGETRLITSDDVRFLHFASDHANVPEYAWWNGLACKIVGRSKGEFGENVEVLFADGTRMITTPGLDPAWGRQ